MSAKPLIPPVININGTAGVDLVHQHSKLIEAFNILQQAFADAAPHGRDYQTKPGLYGEAREAWVQRMKLVALMRTEIERNGVAIVTQLESRNVIKKGQLT